MHCNYRIARALFEVYDCKYPAQSSLQATSAMGTNNELTRGVYMFHICALRNIYTYVVNQQMHSDKTCCIIY